MALLYLHSLILGNLELTSWHILRGGSRGKEGCPLYPPRLSFCLGYGYIVQPQLQAGIWYALEPKHEAVNSAPWRPGGHRVQSDQRESGERSVPTPEPGNLGHCRSSLCTNAGPSTSEFDGRVSGALPPRKPRSPTPRCLA